MSAYGAHHMAGNVKEWLVNPMGDGYVVTGGSWEDPAYLYADYGEATGDACLVGVGLPLRQDGRCRQWGSRWRTLSGRRYANIHPGCPRQNSNPSCPTTSTTAARQIQDSTTRSKPTRGSVSAYGSMVSMATRYWFISTRLATQSLPYQTILYVGSAAVFCCQSLPEQLEWAIGPVIQGGRAVLGVVLKGMVERPWPNHELPASNTVQFRDEMVLHATELRLGLDYLETRTDVDMDRVAYTSVSFGGGSRLPFSAVDDRYSAVVYIGGGIDERVKPTLPEADNVNFAPYVSAPKLLLNGRNDEEHPWLTRALPLWNLLREPKELALIDGGGHVPPLEARIPAMTTFLDATLGRGGEAIGEEGKRGWHPLPHHQG